ncbi:MAG TPA: hypothetical protein VGH20_02730 [Myxococcales bacterium]|jgi:hypothetical protein
MQTGCGVVAASVFGPSTTQQFALRPDTPAAHLTCNGKPCDEVKGTKTTSRESIWAFVAAAAAEGACTVLAARSYHDTGSTGPQVVADVCGGLLAWDLVTVPLAIPLGGMFGEHHSGRLDDRVELTLDGATTQLFGAPFAIPGTQTFAARRTFEFSQDLERRAAAARLCRRRRDLPIGYEVLPVTGDEGALLEHELVAQLRAQLGPPSVALTSQAVFRFHGTAARNDGVTLELRLTSGPHDVELARRSITAPSMEVLRPELADLVRDVYEASCPR